MAKTPPINPALLSTSTLTAPHHQSNLLAFLQIENQPISFLKPDPKNPKIHSRKQRVFMERCLKRFKIVMPVVIDEDGNILCGHLRYLACRALGLSHVPTVKVTHLTKAELRVFQIAENKISELAEWDECLLQERLIEIETNLKLGDLILEPEDMGFEVAEFDNLIFGLPDNRASDPADEISTQAQTVAVTKIGQRWRLRSHVLYCGDALNPASFLALLKEEMAALVFVDPPYNVKVDGHVGGKGRVKHREFAMASGEMDETAFIAFLRQVACNLIRHSVSGSTHYMAMDWRHAWELLSAVRDLYTELRNICVWAKDVAGMGSFYRSQHEFFFVFRSGAVRGRNNVQLGRFGRNRTNIWSYPSVGAFGRQTEEGSLLALHPTVKPVKLVADAILDSSARGDLVLDCFLGSGTTLLAAERTGRRCYGMELDPLYIDVAIRRWQALTGEQAVDVVTGKSFDELGAEVAQ